MANGTNGDGWPYTPGTEEAPEIDFSAVEHERGEALAERVAEFSEEFDNLCQQRHEMGEKKYGPGKFLNVDTMNEALMEIIDLANYARYTYVKVRLLQDRIQREEAQHS